MSKSKRIGLALGGLVLLNGIMVLWLLRFAPVGSHGTKFIPVSLSQHTNGPLQTSWLPNEDPGNNLASLPTGRQELGGVSFDVQGLIQLQGQCWVKRGYVLPKRVEGIPVHRACRRGTNLPPHPRLRDPPRPNPPHPP